MSGSATTTSRTVTAVAPGKVILFGEHAVNRGQPAIAAAVGLYSRCRASVSTDGRFHFRAAGHEQRLHPQEVLQAWQTMTALIEQHDAIRAIKAGDFFAPQKFVLGEMFENGSGEPLALEWDTQLASGSGMGSGGAAFASMVEAVASLWNTQYTPECRAILAYHGDVVAHGGIASPLDTRTSFVGGVIRLNGWESSLLRCPPGLTVVIGDTRIGAATGEVNARVRQWLDARPAARMHTFRTVGALARAAVPALERGDWDELGRLMNLNQLVLEKIGVSCPEAECLIAAALEAGALGAKVSGSGGGGIIVALGTPQTKQQVADAITSAGGRALTPDVAVAGVRLQP